jgi:hypothetical protein
LPHPKGNSAGRDPKILSLIGLSQFHGYFHGVVLGNRAAYRLLSGQVVANPARVLFYFFAFWDRRRVQKYLYHFEKNPGQDLKACPAGTPFIT